MPMNIHIISRQFARWMPAAAPASLLIFAKGRANNQAGRCSLRGPLPFSYRWKTRPINLDVLSFYIDSPMRQVGVDGGVWVMGALPDPYHNPITVPAWKGPDFEHMVRQPDGAADFSQRTASSFINSGLWS